MRDRIFSFLGLRRNLTLVLAANLVIAAGEETWSRFLPKYLETLGASVAVIGLFDAIKTILGAVYAYPGGALADRWGNRRSLILFHLLSVAGYCILLIWPHWIAVIAGMFLFLAWSNLSLPALFSMVAANLPPSQHGMGIAVQSIVRRIPVLIGPIAGGILIDRFGMLEGVRIGLQISIVCGVASVGFQLRIAEAPPAKPGGLDRLPEILRSFSPALRRLLISDILVRYCERIPFAWVVIYAMDFGHASASQVGILVAIEMAVAIASYLPTAHYSDRHGREPFVVVTFLFFTLFPIALWAAGGFWGLALAFAVRGLKEFGDPARKALILQHAPPDARGRVVGAYYLVRDLIVSTGAFAGAALWAWSPEANFAGATLLGVAGTAFYGLSLRRAPLDARHME
ncbi:MAG: MFS transporter [Bryobacteraceae bacterium]